jgi:hypothetical protein
VLSLGHHLRSARRAWALAGLLALTLIALPALGAPAARAATTTAAKPLLDVALPDIPVTLQSATPPHFALDPAQALRLAEHAPRMVALHRAEHPLIYVIMWTPGSDYEIDFWYHKQAAAAVIVWRTGKIRAIYTGGEVLAAYARGHYSPVFDSPWSWVPFALMFLLPLALLRGRAWMARIDLAAVLTFGLSYYLFDTQHLDAAVWLAYPPLLYLLARMLARGLSRRREGAPLEVRMPTWLLAAGLLALIGARIYESLQPPLVMDVGYASLIGAFKILHGQPIYFPSLGHPDTYGPITYLLYAPFELIWPLKSWFSYSPAVRAATITFDLLTIGALVVLGRRLRGGRAGLRLGLLLAWLWAACPFTLLGMGKNTNDGLNALFMVLVLLAWSAPVRRGALLGLAAAAKFFPGILLPLVAARGRDGEPAGTRRVLIGFVVAAGASVAVFLPPGGLQVMWSHTLGYQLTRPDVFSPWALHPALAPVKDLVTLAVVALAVYVAVRPRGPRTLAQLSALLAALTIAVQLPALHWFYLYIVWFWPMVLVGVLGAGSPPAPAPVPEPERVAASDSFEAPGEALALPV